MRWPEILFINKPVGMSSFDVIRRLRKHYTNKTNEKAPKLGHAGTLDPAASGLMILGVGSGTKRLTEFIKLDKEYVAEIIIGRSTTTGDREGTTLESVPVESLSSDVVANALQHMTGRLQLPVSAYSAIKKAGVPMYKRARQAAKLNELVTDVPIRTMEVYESELLGVRDDDGFVVVTVRFHVGSGTYIRSLGEELGRRVGYPASLQSLQRTKIGDHTLADAKEIEEA